VDVADRHPLDPAMGDDYSKCSCSIGWRPDNATHCHCDYHDGRHGCTWGNAEFVRRLTHGWRENRRQLRAREVAHALGVPEDGLSAPVEWFRALPEREEKWGGGTTRIHAFVILPARDDEPHHDSGYRNMGFVGLVNGRAPFRFGGGTDNISFDGIGGGRGDFNSKGEGANWQIECLPGSGLLAVWCREEIEIDNHVLSTFEPKARRRT